PAVMRFLKGVRARSEVEAALARMMASWETEGFGMWVAERAGDGAFVGRVGICRLEQTREIEVGYTLHRAFWGVGYATEGARAALAYGFDTIGLDCIVGIAVVENLASRHVLE